MNSIGLLRRVTTKNLSAFTVQEGPSAAVPSRLVPIALASMEEARAFSSKQRTIALFPFGTGENDASFNFRIYAAFLMNPPTLPGQIEPCAHLFHIASGSATLSTFIGANGGPIGANERYADTLTFATETYGTQLFNHAGTTFAVYSPANNTPAFLTIRGLPMYSIYMECAVSSGTVTDAGFLVSFPM